jgi:hypothetical protein
MTPMRDVIKQIETVIDDDEYPATLDELVVMERILLKITLYHTADKETYFPEYPLPTSRKDRFFPDAVFDYLRRYEKRGHAAAINMDCRMPKSHRQSIRDSCIIA